MNGRRNVSKGVSKISLLKYMCENKIYAREYIIKVKETNFGQYVY